MPVFHVLLFEPEIPPNTGNVIRLCANTGCRLHLIGKLGFEVTEPRLRRAGLDYHEMTTLTTHADLAACLAHIGPTRLWVVETGAALRHVEARCQPGDSFLFGPESRGLPADLLEGVTLPWQQFSLPMRPGNRSLNLSNAVAVTVFEAWRQNGFGGAG
ncbi:MAG: tRNA ((34)/cytosine(34)/5-carboxymethylaminomethyluridine(34)-2-O)-methyltransferase TrmL [Pseudomonadota bacterium]